MEHTELAGGKEGNIGTKTIFGEIIAKDFPEQMHRHPLTVSRPQQIPSNLNFFLIHI